MQADGWITQINDGKTSQTYNANVNTVAEATAAGYQNVQGVSQRATVSASNGSYSYNLNENGSVTNANGSNAQFQHAVKGSNGLFIEGGSLTTAGGTTITTSNLGSNPMDSLPKASGACETTDSLSPAFLFAGLFKATFMGASEAVAGSSELSTVGRWMSQTEYKTMSTTSQMVEGAGGQTFVSTGGSSSFTAAAKGSVYAEFQVPGNSLLQGGQANWFKTIGPSAGNAMQSALQKQGGQLLPSIQNLSPILQVK